MDNSISTLLYNVGLSRVVAQIEKLSLPSIRMISTLVKEEILPFGTSKLGGHPDLPSDIVWPSWRDTPLAFIAQINLAEVHAYDIAGLLPASGILYFFYDAYQIPVGYDPSLKGGWRVFFYNGNLADLRRVPIPQALITKTGTWLPEEQHYTSCSLEYSFETTLPPIDSISINALKLTKQEDKAYLKALQELKRQRISGPFHRLIGHPDALQGNMQAEAQIVSHGIYWGHGTLLGEDKVKAEQLLDEARNWLLLLQLDTDYQAQMVWGTEGRCYYWIQREALLRNDFEGTWFIMQWT